MEQCQKDLLNTSDASECDKEEFELTPRQLLQLYSVISKVRKQRQFELCRPNLKQTAPKEEEELISELKEEGTNADFEETERYIKSSDQNNSPSISYPES